MGQINSHAEESHTRLVHVEEDVRVEGFVPDLLELVGVYNIQACTLTNFEGWRRELLAHSEEKFENEGCEWVTESQGDEDRALELEELAVEK